jgi:hypothetical protein
MLDINDPAHWALTVKAMHQVRAHNRERALLEAIFDGAPTKQNLLDLWQISCDSFEGETRRILQVAIEHSCLVTDTDLDAIKPKPSHSSFLDELEALEDPK